VVPAAAQELTDQKTSERVGYAAAEDALPLLLLLELELDAAEDEEALDVELDEPLSEDPPELPLLLLVDPVLDEEDDLLSVR
jgi:hypothetical protein